MRGSGRKVSNKQSVIIVGAGIGGIATAGRLARNGFDVTVLEKNDRPGGRTDQLIRDGHRFDTGPSLFLMPEVFEETYSALGENMSDQLDLRRIDPTYRIRFGDDTELALTSDLNVMQGQLEAIEPGSFGGFIRYMAEGNQHYKASLEHFVGRNFNSLLDYFSPRNLPLLFKLKALVKHYDNIGNYFRDPRLKAAFTFQNMYLGLSPYDAPATFSLLQYTELADGVWFPMGGMYRVIVSLVEIAEKQGVKFVYNAPVQKIDVHGDRATGVELADGRKLSADIIVANADLPYVYRMLLPDQEPVKKLENKKYTCSTIMFYWGVDKVFPDLGPHNVFLADDYRASFDRIFGDYTLPDDPSFYIHAPARTDPDAAPKGEDTLMVLVPVGHLNARTSQDWEAMQERARTTVLSRLARLGMADLKEHIKFEVSYTPRDWKEMYNLEKGSAFGLSHNFMQVGYLRPQNRHKNYRNLYFAGASTHPGTGLPIVLLSARLTTERILEDYATSRQHLDFGQYQAAGGASS
jgi:phytoene desaturase